MTWTFGFDFGSPSTIDSAVRVGGDEARLVACGNFAQPHHPHGQTLLHDLRTAGPIVLSRTVERELSVA
jgi:hypothetical protein